MVGGCPVPAKTVEQLIIRKLIHMTDQLFPAQSMVGQDMTDYQTPPTIPPCGLGWDQQRHFLYKYSTLTVITSIPDDSDRVSET
jgi:hypothetical protein